MADFGDVYGLVGYAGKLLPQLWLYPHLCFSGNSNILGGSWVRGFGC